MKLRSRSRHHPVTEKAIEIKDAAREFAESDNVREFVSSAGSAVREFASSVSDAAKELLETTEKAAAKSTPKRKRGRLRKLFRMTVMVGGAAAIFANRGVRDKITAQVRKLRGEQEPPPWATPAAQADGARTEPAPQPTT